MIPCPNCNVQYDPNTQYKCDNCGELFWKSKESFEKKRKDMCNKIETDEPQGPVYRPIDFSAVSEEKDLTLHAVISLAGGNTKETIIYDFTKNGISKETAEIIVAKASKIKKTVSRSNGRWEIVSGLGLLTLGGIITAISYSLTEPGQEFKIAIGAIIVGIITLAHGAYKSIVG